MYKIGEWGKAGNDFRTVFKVNITPFYDGLLTLACQHICIDPFKFDDYLHMVYGEYEEQGKSMQDVIIENYGQKGEQLFEKLI